MPDAARGRPKSRARAGRDAARWQRTFPGALHERIELTFPVLIERDGPARRRTRVPAPIARRIQGDAIPPGASRPPASAVLTDISVSPGLPREMICGDT